jgi:hypothetical protein
MNETVQIILGLSILIPVYVLTRKYHAWKIRRTYLFIIRDLKAKDAFDPSSAVKLPYATAGLFHMGTRDYRPKALAYMVTANIVGRTEEGHYYLKDREAGLSGLK